MMSYFTLRYSGGEINNAPDLSLGGEMSGVVLTGTNIFSDITETQAIDGKIDYRCVYALNHSGFSLTGTNLTINSQELLGSSIKIGTRFDTEEQIIRIKGVITGGSIDITYNGFDGTPYTFTSNYELPSESWAASIQGDLRTIPGLSNITVTAYQSPTTPLETAFKVVFGGESDYRYHNLLDVTNNIIGGAEVYLTKMVNGSPINGIAQFISNEKTVPANVVFTNGSTPIVIGNIAQNELFPIWFERTTTSNTKDKSRDGFSMKIQSISAI